MNYSGEFLVYIRDHWGGRHSLVRSFWINSVILLMPLDFIDLYVEAKPYDWYYTHLWYVFAYLLLAPPATFWAGVGTIRAAQIHIRMTGRTFWARFAVVLDYLSIVAATYSLALFVYYGFTDDIFFDGMVPAEVTLVGEDTIYIHGDIDYETPDDFIALLSAHPDIDTVQIDSYGGYILESVEIAEIILEKDLDTYSSLFCQSACTNIFMAGRRRSLDYDTPVGFHLGDRPEYDEVTGEVLDDDGDIFLIERGVPRDFVNRAKKVPNEDMWEPTMSELVAANFVTHIFDYKNDVTYEADRFCEKYACDQSPSETTEMIDWPDEEIARNQ